jgi:hypothetical protein
MFAGLMSRWKIPVEKISPISLENPPGFGSPISASCFISPVCFPHNKLGCTQALQPTAVPEHLTLLSVQFGQPLSQLVNTFPRDWFWLW